MPQATTMSDIAEAAGISIAAVSMILAGKGKISPSLIARVQALALEMGYSRRVREKRPGARRFKYVSILQSEDFPYLWNFSHPFATYLEERVSQMGYYPIILHVPVSADPATIFKEIRGAQVGGVFAIHYANPQLFEELEKAGIPVILINNSEYQTQFYSVLADEVQAASEATKHLISLGHRAIGYADYSRPQYPTLVNDRFFGYWKALEESGLEYREEHRIAVSLTDFEALADKVAEIFRRPSPPTAFSVHDDYFAAYLHEALKRIGKQVPRDVSLIATGGDVLDYGEPFIPKIDTMRIDQKLMVAMAWSLLESRLKSPTESIQVLKAKMPFVGRGSSRFEMD